MDFAGARLCFDLQKLEAGEFLAGSGDGEILLGTFIRPPGSDNPDYCQLCHQPHAGGWGQEGWRLFLCCAMLCCVLARYRGHSVCCVLPFH
jgi:hypothetical protein